MIGKLVMVFTEETIVLLSIVEELIKPLLPLGFSRADIRREVLLSKGDLNTAALKLLAQQDEHELKFISLDEVDGEVKEKQKKDDDKKTFAIKSIVVSSNGIVSRNPRPTLYNIPAVNIYPLCLIHRVTTYLLY